MKMSAKALVYLSKEQVTIPKWNTFCNAKQPLPLFFLLLSPDLAFNTIEKKLKCLRYQDHNRDTLRSEEFHQRIRGERSRVNITSTNMENGYLYSQLEHMAQGED